MPPLSDLRAACIHGRYDEHEWVGERARHHCPGGREVTIDFEAGIEAWWRAYGTGGQYNPATRAAIAAALGDTDEASLSKPSHSGGQLQASDNDGAGNAIHKEYQGPTPIGDTDG